jgi:hypothetical protein
MLTGVLERLDEAIRAVAELDVDTLGDSELDDLVIALQRARHRLAGVAAGPLARWDARGVWQSDGSRSAATRLARDANTATTTATIELRRARRLTDMPATTDAVCAGVLSMDHVDLFGRADQPHRHDLFVRDEAMLVGQCVTLRHRQAVRAVEYWMQRADGERGDSPAPRDADRSRLHASTTWKATVRLDGTLDKVDGAIVADELGRLERQVYLADVAAGVTRSNSERLGAALVEMATRSASTPADAQRPRPLFSVLLGDDTFVRLCELGNGTVITPEVIVADLATADIETILFDGPFTVIAASPARSFTGRLRRAIEVRDRHCQHPSGCDVPAQHCDVDHIVAWEAGGATSQFNGRMECRPHNRDATKHDHGAQPHPQRRVDYLDQLRARLRWQLLHQPPDDDDEDENQRRDPAA